jgi:hypothetical protein
MKVYHGTNIVIEQPEIINRLKTLDFGDDILLTSAYYSNNGNNRDFFNKLKAKHLFDLLCKLI